MEEQRRLDEINKKKIEAEKKKSLCCYESATMTYEYNPSSINARSISMHSSSSSPPELHNEGGVVDYTKIPALLERKIDELDGTHALRPTIINAKATWDKYYQKDLFLPLLSHHWILMYVSFFLLFHCFVYLFFVMLIKDSN